MSQTQGRFISLRTGGHVENMSIDQALLESVGADGPPVLRLYQWASPTLSLGYFQKLADRGRHTESGHLECVRRATGGGAIVHHHDLTYSIVMPLRSLPGGPSRSGVDLYRTLHQAAIEVLRRFGVRADPYRLAAGDRVPTRECRSSRDADRFLCFQRRTGEDLVVSGYKVLGSAQRKTKHAILQHGSLLLRASPNAPQLPGISDLTNCQIPVVPLAERLSNAVGDHLSIGWHVDEILSSEHERATAIAEQKFGAERWQSRR